MRQPLLLIIGSLSVVVICLAAATAAPVPKKAGDERAVSNPANDIHVVTDRDESVKDYFTRTRLVVGRVSTFKGGDKSPGVGGLLEAKETIKVFVSHPSPNDAKNELLFGTKLQVAPPTVAVVKLVKGAKDEGAVDLIFRKGDDGVHQLIGYTTRGQVDFFGNTAVNKDDGYSPSELRFVEVKE